MNIYYNVVYQEQGTGGAGTVRQAPWKQRWKYRWSTGRWGRGLPLKGPAPCSRGWRWHGGAGHIWWRRWRMPRQIALWYWKQRSFQHASRSQETGPGKTFPDYSCGSANVYTPALSFGCAEVDFPNCLRSASPLQKRSLLWLRSQDPGGHSLMILVVREMKSVRGGWTRRWWCCSWRSCPVPGGRHEALMVCSWCETLLKGSTRLLMYWDNLNLQLLIWHWVLGT